MEREPELETLHRSIQRLGVNSYPQWRERLSAELLDHGYCAELLPMAHIRPPFLAPAHPFILPSPSNSFHIPFNTSAPINPHESNPGRVGLNPASPTHPHHFLPVHSPRPFHSGNHPLVEPLSTSIHIRKSYTRSTVSNQDASRSSSAIVHFALAPIYFHSPRSGRPRILKALIGPGESSTLKSDQCNVSRDSHVLLNENGGYLVPD
ncbi:hypothetical protein CROQUDRAFT_85624 [Cronartium quercuum f. sp. fusiforme G11]|uniref:Uncharacterized protein n=1 Tax=Cronartium quercuum f. sp. fusiforme G11 TaxID=708437 RepID=A0A9P6NSA6_9BASI|nr:hypothetical protein CROQUDRAFT_85624 [Cronartium quercuum f. sp. fusiforme G11]